MIYSQENRAVSLIIGIIATLFFSSILAIFIIIIQGKQITPDQGIVQTGVVRLNTVPNDVDVLVNDKPATKNGNVISNLTLGVNKITLTKEGYSVWQKDIDVKSDKVNDIFVQLFPDELNLEQFTSLNIDRIYLNDDLSKAIFSVTNSEIESEIGLWELSLNRSIINISGQNKPEKVLSFTDDFLNILKTNDYKINNSNENIVFELFIDGKNEFYITGLDFELIDISELIGVKVDSLKLYENYIIAKKEGLIFSYSIQNKNKAIISLVESDQDTDYCINGTKVFFGNLGGNKINFSDVSGSGLSEITANNNLKKIVCSENNNFISYISIDNRLNIIKINEPVEFSISDSSEILSMSRLGDKFITDSLDGTDRNIVRITNLENISKSIPPEIKTFSIDKNSRSYFTDSGNNIVFETTFNNEESQIQSFAYSISDFDGMNTKNILNNNALLKNSELRLSQDGKYLFLVIDSSSIESSMNLEKGQDLTSNFNLYRISLVE